MSTSIFKANYPEAIELKQKTKESRYAIGLDIHKKTIAITVIDKESNQENQIIYQRKRLKNEDLIKTMQRYSDQKCSVAIEACYGWKPIAEALETLEGVTFVMFNARKTVAWVKATGVKNDTIDSEVLARMLIDGNIEALSVYIPSNQSQQGMKLVKHRDALVKRRTQTKNRLKNLQRDYGINPYTGELKAKSIMIQKIENNLLDELNFCNQKIKEIETIMNQVVKEDEVVDILKSIPGIGSITAFALRHKIDNISRFATISSLSSYLGLAIRQRQSGDNSVSGKITKQGNCLVRKLLVQGGQALYHKSFQNTRWYFLNMLSEEHKDKKHSNKIVTAIARKSLSFAYACWRKREKFDLQSYILKKKQIYEKIQSEKLSKDQQKQSVLNIQTDSKTFDFGRALSN